MTQPLPLVAVSILLYVLASNGLWWALSSSERVMAYAIALTSGPADRVLLLVTLPKVLYRAGIPLLAIGLRLAGPATAWGFNQPLSLAHLLAALASSSIVAAALIAQSRRLGVASRGDTAGTPGTAQRLAFAWLDALSLELHWAMYRAGCLATGLAGQTASVYLSLCLVGLQAWASPATRLAWRHLSSDPSPLWPAAACVLSASLFLWTGSVWPSVAAHAWLALLLVLAQAARLVRGQTWELALQPERTSTR